MKILSVLIFSMFICGCVSKEEQIRRLALIDNIRTSRYEMAVGRLWQGNPMPDSVILHNVNFYTDWLIDLKKRGYPVTDEDIGDVK
jgi:hypothetical protein